MPCSCVALRCFAFRSIIVVRAAESEHNSVAILRFGFRFALRFALRFVLHFALHFALLSALRFALLSALRLCLSQARDRTKSIQSCICHVSENTAIDIGSGGKSSEVAAADYGRQPTLCCVNHDIKSAMLIVSVHPTVFLPYLLATSNDYAY